MKTGLFNVRPIWELEAQNQMVAYLQEYQDLAHRAEDGVRGEGKVGNFRSNEGSSTRLSINWLGCQAGLSQDSDCRYNPDSPVNRRTRLLYKASPRAVEIKF